MKKEAKKSTEKREQAKNNQDLNSKIETLKKNLVEEAKEYDQTNRENKDLLNQLRRNRKYVDANAATHRLKIHDK